MNIKQVKSLIKQGESNTVEFKKSTTQLKSAFETICAFLNGNGGVVLIGINDKGHIVGQNISDATKQEIAREINKIEPSAEITVSYKKSADDKYIIIIHARNGQYAPYVYDSRPFQRDQSTTTKMSQSSYDKLIASRVQNNYSWERFIAQGYKINLLNENLIMGVVRKGVERQRLPEVALRQELPQLLESLNLITDNFLNNAVVALFGTQFMPNYPQCQLKMARFKGLDRHEFLDSEIIYGNAFDLLESGMLFVKRHIPVAARIESGKLERVETPLIPFNAIREALINALCHRDYSVYGGSIGLAIYDDRMEIFNNGGLLPGITLAKIKSGFSKLRNPIIADVFYKANLIEKWGRGIQEIIKSCMDVGDPAPQFITDSVEFKVLFTFPVSIQTRIATYETLLTKRQQEIIEILSKVEEITMKKILQQLKESIADRTLRDDLLALKKKGIINSKGHARTAVWFITKK